ncbi:MAG: hypothetical protein LR015_06525 [Verrucomicrobia bacterium]|nr:hypothetical protein [Verrucomicrobiota bacterium]
MILRTSILSLLLLLPAWLFAAAQERTVITSESLEMQGTDERNYFHFRTDVVVLGTNLEIRCDELTVIASRFGDDDATVGEIGAIERIIAVGNVQIHQAGRSAFCEHAEVDPRAGTVTLSGRPRVVDRDVEVEGFMFILHRDQRRFQSIPDPNAPASAPSRSVVRLGALPDLGFSQDEEQIAIPVPAVEIPSAIPEEDSDTNEE